MILYFDKINKKSRYLMKINYDIEPKCDFNIYRGEVWAHKANLSLSIFIEVPEPLF
jgi:hypothetical protein